jgi:hypothetical protein
MIRKKEIRCLEDTIHTRGRVCEIILGLLIWSCAKRINNYGEVVPSYTKIMFLLFHSQHVSTQKNHRQEIHKKYINYGFL